MALHPLAIDSSFGGGKGLIWISSSSWAQAGCALSAVSLLMVETGATREEVLV
jgi:hypothetical protein